MASFPRLKQWILHHTTSVIATGADFASMVTVVELTGVSPVVGTVIGATVGAFTNFMLARHWTYRRPKRNDDGTVPVQVARYLLVSLVSLGLNAAGEHVFANLLHVQYVLGRVITAVIVSNAWNYPMQRFFVFGDRTKDKEASS
ncbi:MAG: GtrA family protein [Deltaproteobacteria bacterium]|nr:GtrA family protein [Deltaproteobacteria bacterium]